MEDVDAEMREVLVSARTIAVVGLSDKPDRDSYEVARYLQSKGYRIIPVNPMVREVLGEKSYASVAAIPSDIHIDIVDIFRKSDQVLPIVEEALTRGVDAIWMQLGVENPDGATAARARGLAVFENVCIMQQHRRLRIPPRSPPR
ncbi:MAG: CoA-binding protein [Thermoplasmata archaeon]|nr:CoA-binding protein [Thermoplasmata archaeon]